MGSLLKGFLSKARGIKARRTAKGTEPLPADGKTETAETSTKLSRRRSRGSVESILSQRLGGDR